MHRTVQIKSGKVFPSFTLELQAEFNQEFLEDLHQLELDDWAAMANSRQTRRSNKAGFFLSKVSGYRFDLFDR